MPSVPVYCEFWEPTPPQPKRRRKLTAKQRRARKAQRIARKRAR
jgi:hypothetical protein